MNRELDELEKQRKSEAMLKSIEMSSRIDENHPAIVMMRSERMRRTETKLAQRKALADDLGLQGGLLYKRHRDKLLLSRGFMRTGNVSHFISTRPAKKTRSRDRYGLVYDPAKRDAVRLDSMNDQLQDILEDDHK